MSDRGTEPTRQLRTASGTEGAQGAERELSHSAGRPPVSADSRTGCKTPWKIAYESRREAVTAHRFARNKTGQLKPYHCRCGFWHLTSMPRAEFKRVRRQLRTQSV